jgi:hypothetical protein
MVADNRLAENSLWDDRFPSTKFFPAGVPATTSIEITVGKEIFVRAFRPPLVNKSSLRASELQMAPRTHSQNVYREVSRLTISDSLLLFADI